MNKSSHLVHLENELEEDLAEARRLVARGRHDAIAELNSHGEELGALRERASHHIERCAHVADEDLKMVRMRLGELHMLLTKEELKDLDVFDHFRDRVVEAMEFAEDDMEELKQRGDHQWSSSTVAVKEAWHQLSRRLSLVRMHLVQEVETAMREFRAERREMVNRAKPSVSRAQMNTGSNRQAEPHDRDTASTMPMANEADESLGA